MTVAIPDDTLVAGSTVAEAARWLKGRGATAS